MSKIIENYLLTETVGQGQYGKVYKATHKKIENSLYAIKTIKLDKFKTVPQLNQFTLNEIQTLAKISHINIIKFTEMLRSTNNVYMVYEYCSGGTLEDKIKQSKGGMDESQALYIIAQIVKAFQILSKENILHRDLKPQNILFDDEDTTKIADFGFCKTLPHKNSMTQTMVGSPIYMSPEVLKGQPYNTKADVWSLGVVLFEMLFGYCPYEEKTIARLIQKINTYKLHIPKNKKLISPECEQLLHQIITLDQRARIDWVQLYNHPLLKPYIAQADAKEKQLAQKKANKQQKSTQQKKGISLSNQENSNYNSEKSNSSQQQNGVQQQQQQQEQPVLQEIQNNNTNIQQEQKTQDLKAQNNQKQQQQKLKKQRCELDKMTQLREKIIYQIKVVGNIINKNCHKYSPILALLIVKNACLMLKEIKFQVNSENLQQDAKQILDTEIQTLEQCLNLFSVETEKISSKFSSDSQILLNEIKNSDLKVNQVYFREIVLDYVSFINDLNKISLQSSVQQMNEYSDTQKSTLVHSNEILDCLLIRDIFDEKQPDSLKLNPNLQDHDNQHLQDLLQNKLQYTEIKKSQQENSKRNSPLSENNSLNNQQQQHHVIISDNEVKEKIQSFNNNNGNNNIGAFNQSYTQYNELKSPLY